MSQWKLFANASTNTSGPVQWMSSAYQQGSGNANEQANNLALANGTSNQINSAPQFGGNGTNQVAENWTVQQLAFTAAAYANATANTTANSTYTGEGRKIPGGPGWVVRKAWEGPITGLTAANGQAFANGETVLLSNGSTNAVATLVANATGNLVSATVVTQGTFPNTADVAITFNSELHVANVQIGANAAAFTNLPAANSPVTVTVSNTGNSFAIAGNNGLVAVGTFVSNIATGITNTVLNTITWAGANTPPFANAAGFWGLFSNNQTNTAVVIVFSNANGQVIANGTPATLATHLVTHGGTPNVTVTSLGGRAGRVMYETLVSTRFIANGSLATGAYMNVTNLSVTGTATNTFANTDYIVISNGATINAYANLVTNSVGGGVTNTSGLTIESARGYGGGYFPTGTVNNNLVITVYQANGAVLGTGNSSTPINGVTFVANVGAVSANSAAFLPQ